MDDDEYGKIIEFPKNKKGNKSKEDTSDQGYNDEPVVMTKESVVRLVKTLATIHLATTYRARKNEKCQENIKVANFPCKLNCACYVNVCAAMGLESFLGGETQKEAILLVEAEHELIKTLHTSLLDEDDEDE
tara:strand:+ start:1810 stop:2205 length:396 start_codon:yes stop_codon:yes gene_type:complete